MRLPLARWAVCRLGWLAYPPDHENLPPQVEKGTLDPEKGQAGADPQPERTPTERTPTRADPNRSGPPPEQTPNRSGPQPERTPNRSGPGAPSRTGRGARTRSGYLRYRQARGVPGPVSQMPAVRDRPTERPDVGVRALRRLGRTLVPTTVLVSGLCSVLVLTLLAASPSAAATAAYRPTAPAPPHLVDDPASLVHPMDGTGAGPVKPGAIAEFPGADVPFGMIQWSPDTVPNTAGSGGGYSYADTRINGFSLTHLSGAGCPAYGDVPILPTTGPVGTDPATLSDSFSHSTEEAAPGRYGVTLGSPGITTHLAVTTRSGISSFAFPATDSANVLFKVADSANPAVASSLHVVGDHEVTGQVTSGQFCSTGTNYTVYFAATLRPVLRLVRQLERCNGETRGRLVLGHRLWRLRHLRHPFGSRRPHEGRDLLRQRRLTLRPTWPQRIPAGRSAGSRPSPPGTGIPSWTGRGLVAAHRPNSTRSTPPSTTPCSTPTSSATPTAGTAGRTASVHRVTDGSHYANFSEWDIYRSQIELVSLLAPDRAGAMVQSLVDDADQGGWLPKWAIVDGDASQMNGDSADPIIAAAYAFGVRGFDVKAALAAMVKGATRNETGHGFEIERQYLTQYLSQHYVDAGALDLSSIDYSLRRVGDPRVRHRRFLHRPVGPGRGQRSAVPVHDGAGPRLAVPLQPGHRLRRGTQRRRELPPRSGLPVRPLRGRG